MSEGANEFQISPEVADQAKVDQILDKEGVRATLTELSTELQEQGDSVMFGMTADGLVVGMNRKEDDDYNDIFTAIAVDATLPAGDIGSSVVKTTFSDSDLTIGMVRGGPYQFPDMPNDGSQIGSLDALSLEDIQAMTEEQVREIIPKRDKSFALFYKKVGGKVTTSTISASDGPSKVTSTVGGKPAYELKLG